MMRQSFTLFVLAAGLAVTAGPLLAHHGTGISYDLNAPLITLKGTVTELAFRNPHVSIFIDVMNEDGSIVHWALEHSNVASLARRGYNRNSLRSGEEVTAVAYPSRGGGPVGLTFKIIRADGTELLHRDQAGAPQPTQLPEGED